MGGVALRGGLLWEPNPHLRYGFSGNHGKLRAIRPTGSELPSTNCLPALGRMSICHWLGLIKKKLLKLLQETACPRTSQNSWKRKGWKGAACIALVLQKENKWLETRGSWERKTSESRRGGSWRACAGTWWRNLKKSARGTLKSQLGTLKVSLIEH